MKVIAYTNNDGKVSIMTPYLECGLSIEEIADKDVPDSLPYIILDDSELPDRELRNSWKIVDSKVVIVQ